MMTQNLCACGSEKSYETCCSPIIHGKANAKTAEDLLRARYTAFTLGEVDFVIKSHHSKTVGEVKRSEIEEWSKSSEWMGLKILEKEAGTETDEKGTLVFQAQYKIKDKVEDHFEKSFFEKENGQWKFLDAHGLQQGPYVRPEPKLGRNDPCHCGSGKKFKKCHAA